MGSCNDGDFLHYEALGVDMIDVHQTSYVCYRMPKVQDASPNRHPHGQVSKKALADQGSSADPNATRSQENGDTHACMHEVGVCAINNETSASSRVHNGRLYSWLCGVHCTLEIVSKGGMNAAWLRRSTIPL